MSSFLQLVEYAAGFDPKFPRMIVGATNEQISRLRSLVNSELPAIYIDFLKLMGQDTDWLGVRKIDFSIDKVIEFYERVRWMDTNRYLRIGEDQEDLHLDPYLEISALEEQPVVSIPRVREHEFEDASIFSSDPVAGSLVEMFAMPVFEMFELRADAKRPVCLRAGEWDAAALPRVEHTATALGFEKLWFSSSTGQAYRRNDQITIRASQLTGYPLQIYISAPERPRAEIIADEFIKVLESLKKVG